MLCCFFEIRQFDVMCYAMCIHCAKSEFVYQIAFLNFVCRDLVFECLIKRYCKLEIEICGAKLLNSLFFPNEVSNSVQA